MRNHSYENVFHLLVQFRARLLAVPFKIVAKAREIAERKRKTGANERRERGERRCFSPCSSLAALCALGSHALATI